MWLKDIYYRWRQRKMKKAKKRYLWETVEKQPGDVNAESAAEFYDRVKGMCPYCHKRFDMPGNLRRHILTEHPDNIEEDEQKAECRIERRQEKGK